ncbi:hypothetical protein A6V36_13680 [Paraburkholderia ginsengiterrae]|uniref:Uncharacterized protein n=1 Tax=Paraburkholderia ginsengiterrae TaxID=1462993 RepID=A0A1A9MZQ8_9BURK|nr:hypothetical protein A6V36_13680 [Paraburkholderia ginsengiterrae]OAJ52666.1 hypothetical protein A6V37_09525 [Paraburkholderia ginsengiterrae]
MQAEYTTCGTVQTRCYIRSSQREQRLIVNYNQIKWRMVYLCAIQGGAGHVMMQDCPEAFFRGSTAITGHIAVEFGNPGDRTCNETERRQGQLLRARSKLVLFDNPIQCFIESVLDCFSLRSQIDVFNRFCDECENFIRIAFLSIAPECLGRK